MKRIISIILIFIFSLGALSCSKENIPTIESTNSYYRVRFIINETTYSEDYYEYYNEIVLPKNPYKPDHKFDYWYYDKDKWEDRLDLSRNDKIEGDIDLYAHFIFVDYRDIISDFTVSLIKEDKEFRLYDNLDKINIINIWYKECPPCIKEMPYLNEAAEVFSDLINVVAIHEGSIYNPNTVDFLNKNFPNSKIIFAKDDKESTVLNKIGGAKLYPKTLFINKEGRIAYTKNGAMNKKELFSLIDLVLSEYK